MEHNGKKGIPFHLIKTIQSMYRDSGIAIAGNESVQVITNMGLRQGCSMYPVLYNLYIDDVLRQWMQKLAHYTHHLNNLGCILTAVFADDQVIIADSEDSLQRAAHEFSLVAKEYNLVISPNKTKAMAFKDGLEPAV